MKEMCIFVRNSTPKLLYIVTYGVLWIFITPFIVVLYKEKECRIKIAHFRVNECSITTTQNFKHLSYAVK